MAQAILKKTYILSLVTVFAVLFASVCPYICDFAQASVQSHSCCPEDKSHHEQKQDKEKSEQCCSQLEQATIVKQVADSSLDSVHYQFITFVIQHIKLLALDNAIAFNMVESPPGLSFGEPLYIIKSSFLI